uniref:Uncharacterized protein n=1 Tax=Anguilla anguilla TaxID=7936 RepID=A0A0E9SAR4_ANGAN
MQYSSAQSF